MPVRILIVFGTTDGHTAKVATAISNTLRAEGADVDLVQARPGGPDPNPADYAAVIVAGSVHTAATSGRYGAGCARTRRASTAGRTAFVSVCLGILERTAASEAELAGIMENFFETTQWMPSVRKSSPARCPTRATPGSSDWSFDSSSATRDGQADSSRDYEYTDWNDVRDFARHFVRLVHHGEPARVAV